METEETAVGTHKICVRDRTRGLFSINIQNSLHIWLFLFKCGKREISSSLHSYHSDFDLFYKRNFVRQMIQFW